MWPRRRDTYGWVLRTVVIDFWLPVVQPTQSGLGFRIAAQPVVFAVALHRICFLIRTCCGLRRVPPVPPRYVLSTPARVRRPVQRVFECDRAGENQRTSTEVPLA